MLRGGAHLLRGKLVPHNQLLSFQLPIHLYESLIEILDGQPHVLYTHVSYSLATEEAERIGVDHIARSSVTGTTHTSAGMCGVAGMGYGVAVGMEWLVWGMEWLVWGMECDCGWYGV